MVNRLNSTEMNIVSNPPLTIRPAAPAAQSSSGSWPRRSMASISSAIWGRICRVGSSRPWITWGRVMASRMNTSVTTQALGRASRMRPLASNFSVLRS